MDEATTDFGQYSHGELKRMVDSLNSGDIMKAADPWRRTYDTLKGIRTALQSYSGQATTDWEGQASDAFYTRMTKLANSVNNTAEYANDTAVTLEIVADSIDEAKAAMPDEPSAWDRTTDWVDDKVSGLFGADDADTRQSEADSRKQRAVAIMQTLARRYQASAAILNPPAAGSWGEKDEEWPPPAPDPTGAGAISGAIVGAGLGGISAAAGGSSGSGNARRSRSTATAGSPGAATDSSRIVTDAAIHGGTAVAATSVPASPGAGAGTGLDGSVGGIAGGTRVPTTGGVLPGGGSPASHGIGGGIPATGGGPVGGAYPAAGSAPGVGRGRAGSGDVGRSGEGAGRSRSAMGGSVIGEGSMRQGGEHAAGGVGTGGGLGAGARESARRGSGSARRSGGIIGESTRSGSSGVFTEGGTGIGSRSRLGQPFGGASSRGRKKDEERRGERPDYLVEDEETWVDGERPNPGVVE
ncbi:PPE domain-containing protein [Peterkaempfera bronchialis]|uniref:PPE domain-containing protein n=1 Tax=Peterkaempfera bronchialis TaxID=2126346 RepID=A0A345SVI6_9ACTN|nr:PPE domain-containing protein [Peterkaempfera bronchialis]AXI77741.1 PPE domain-containing protein [Peterkaempfera bronchialis]